MNKSFFDTIEHQFYRESYIEGQFYVPNFSSNPNDLINVRLSNNILSLRNRHANIENAYLQRIGRKCLTIIKNKIELSLMGEIDDVYNELCIYCIQTDFFNKYTIQQQVGKGHYGKVYIARNKYNLQENAVKVFDKLNFTQMSDRQVLLKEVSILRQLKHPNIVQLKEFYETKSNIYIVFEYYQLGDLSNFLASNTLNEIQCKQLFTDLLNAVQYIHQQGIFHRDIKPSNLLLNKKMQLILGDFGLADYYKKDGKYLFTRCGTPGYVAPEILQDKIYDFKVDVYSLGVLLHIMLTGKLLFQAAKEQDVVSLNLENKFQDQLDQSLTKEQIDLLNNMLDTDPVSRFSITQCKQHPWLRQPQSVPLHIRLRIQNKTKSNYPDSEDNSPQITTASPRLNLSKHKNYKIRLNTPRMDNNLTFEKALKQSQLICKTEPEEIKINRKKLQNYRYSLKKLDFI